MRIATWNVAGLQARREELVGWLQENQPTVMGLQEIKTCKAKFLNCFRDELRKQSYHAEFHSEPRWNGVAILSKYPLKVTQKGLPGQEGLAELEEIARRVARLVSGAGGDPIPDELQSAASEEGSGSDIVTIPFHQDVRAAAGSGEPVFNEDTDVSINLSRGVLPSWAKEESLVCISARGDSDGANHPGRKSDRPRSRRDRARERQAVRCAFRRLVGSQTLGARGQSCGHSASGRGWIGRNEGLYDQAETKMDASQRQQAIPGSRGVGLGSHHRKGAWHGPHGAKEVERR